MRMLLRTPSLGLYFSAAHPGIFHQLRPATRIRHRIVVLDEASLDTGISSPDEIELQEHHSSNTEGIDLDEYPWAGRSLGELKNTPPAIESQNLGRHSSYPIFDVLLLSDELIQYRLQGRLWKLEEIPNTIYCCREAVPVRLGH